MSELMERLQVIADHDWRVCHIAHTSDTAREAKARIEALEYENEAMRRTFGSDPLFKERDSRIAALEAELRRVLEWAVDEKLPLRGQEIRSIRTLLGESK